jgi:putative zinc finger/helix-turn-helix YgiT family protein
MSRAVKTSSRKPAVKPYPWKCGRCGARSVVPAIVSYTSQIEHDGRAYSVTVPDLEIPRCSKCAAMVRDDAANRRISLTLRRQLGLLTPEQIRQNRESLGLTQKQLASRLGIAEATLSRWETGGQIQQRSMDKLMRLFFAFDNVRTVLEHGPALQQLGEPVLARQSRRR